MVPAPALLLLADGRFPSGGHAHSGGVEIAVARGTVRDLDSLAAFVAGRLGSVAHVDACLAAAAAHRVAGVGEDRGAVGVVLDLVDREAEVRMPVAALREASRRLGRQLVRSAAVCWPATVIDVARDVRPGGLHLAVASGLVGGACGLPAGAVATVVLHNAAATCAQAAVRLLGLDPFGATAVVAGMAADIARLAAAAEALAAGDLADLPADAALLADLDAELHARHAEKLFVT